MAATGGLHHPMNRVAEGPGTGPVTYLGLDEAHHRTVATSLVDCPVVPQGTGTRSAVVTRLDALYAGAGTVAGGTAPAG